MGYVRQPSGLEVVGVVVILWQILGDVVVFGVELGHGVDHTCSATQIATDTSSVMPTK